MSLGLEPFAARVDRLPPQLKAALAAACAQRQAEVYHAYVRRTGGGSSQGFDRLLSAIWDDVRNPQASELDHKRWEAYGNRLHNQRHKDDIYGAAAGYAVLSLLYSNDVLVGGRTRETIFSAKKTFHSIHNFLTSPIGKKPPIDISQRGSLDQFYAHPLTQAEHRRQEQDLFDVERAALHPEMIPAVVEGLRRRSAMEAKDFLPIVEGARA
jgi:hypothetical protein